MCSGDYWSCAHAFHGPESKILPPLSSEKPFFLSTFMNNPCEFVKRLYQELCVKAIIDTNTNWSWTVDPFPLEQYCSR